MHDEVRAFVAAMDAAQEKYDATKPRLGGQHDVATCRTCLLEKARKVTLESLESATDPLVRWIAKNCKGYEEEAGIVLRALPASMAELDAIAERHEWCGDWVELRRQAERDGVLPVMAEASEQ